MPWWEPFTVPAGATLDDRRDRRARAALLPGRARRLRRAVLPGQRVDVHARQVRRARRARPGGRRRAAARAATSSPARASRADTAGPAARDRDGLGDRGHRGTARGTGVLHQGRHRRAVRQQLHRAPQLGAHRRPAHRAAPVVGTRGRRRGRAAPVQHPRRPLRGRRARLHRGHADHPRPGRAEPRRVRLPGGHRERRAVEDGAASAGGHRALRAGARGGRGVPAGPARHARARAHRR